MSRENNKIWKALLAGQRAIMVVTAVIVTIIVSAAMILRSFNIDLVGYEEVLIMFAFWLYMIGSAYGSYEKSQIAADILNVYLKEGKVKATINLIKTAVTLILGIVLNYWAFQLLAWAIQMNTRTPVWRLPMAIGQGSMFVGLTLTTFYNMVYFYDEIKSFKKTIKGGISRL